MADLRVALFEHLEKMELSPSSPRPRPATFRRAFGAGTVEARFDDAVEFTGGNPAGAPGRTAEGRCEPLTQPSVNPEGWQVLPSAKHLVAGNC